MRITPRGQRPSPLFPYTTLFRSGLRQLRHNQQLAGARTCHIPKPFALAHQTFVVSLERSEKLGWLDVADHPMQGVVVGTMHRSEEHTSELQSLTNLVCRLLLDKK